MPPLAQVARDLTRWALQRRAESWSVGRFFATLDPARGSQTQKTGPVVLVINNAANRAAAVVTVLPLTSTVERAYPFEEFLAASDTGLLKGSKAMAQQVLTLDKALITGRAAGVVQADDMRKLNGSLRLHLGL